MIVFHHHHHLDDFTRIPLWVMSLRWVAEVTETRVHVKLIKMISSAAPSVSGVTGIEVKGESEWHSNCGIGTPVFSPS